MAVTTIGWVPKAVKLYVGGLEAYWNDAMPAGSMYKRLANGTGSLVTGGNGISQDAGGSGFDLGADADINSSGATITYEVIAE
jgi:hypothetical protein